jgi:hypothetical protein
LLSRHPRAAAAFLLERIRRGFCQEAVDEQAADLLSYGEAKLVFTEDEEEVDKLLAERRAADAGDRTG